jgi:hypothetical protein
VKALVAVAVVVVVGALSSLRWKMVPKAAAHLGRTA